jgi:hypothetical protein
MKTNRKKAGAGQMFNWRSFSGGLGEPKAAMAIRVKVAERLTRVESDCGLVPAA